MTNKKFWLVMLVLILVFGMTVIGCDIGTSGENGTTNGNGNGSSNGGDNGNGSPLPPGGLQYYNFSEARFNVIAAPTSEAMTFDWLTIGAGVNRGASNAPPFSHFITTGGVATGTRRFFRLQLAGPAEITIWAISNNTNPTYINIEAPTSIEAIPLPRWQSGAAGMQQQSFRSETNESHTVTLIAVSSSRFFQIRVSHD